jgi:hypothetical protein
MAYVPGPSIGNRTREQSAPRVPTLAHGRLVAAISTRQVGGVTLQKRKGPEMVYTFSALGKEVLAAIGRSPIDLREDPAQRERDTADSCPKGTCQWCAPSLPRRCRLHQRAQRPVSESLICAHQGSAVRPLKSQPLGRFIRAPSLQPVCRTTRRAARGPMTADVKAHFGRACQIQRIAISAKFDASTISNNRSFRSKPCFEVARRDFPTTIQPRNIEQVSSFVREPLTNGNQVRIPLSLDPWIANSA